MQVQVLYFGMVRELAGGEGEPVEAPANAMCTV